MIVPNERERAGYDYECLRHLKQVSSIQYLVFSIQYYYSNSEREGGGHECLWHLIPPLTPLGFPTTYHQQHAGDDHDDDDQ